MLKQRGAFILVGMLAMMLIASIIVFSTASSITTKQRITANVSREIQSFEAAEAGIEFGIAYGEQNIAAILTDADSNGFIDDYSASGITDVTLANGAKYSVTYSNPTANDFNIIEITSIGTSNDGTVSRTIKQQVYRNEFLSFSPPAGISAHHDVNLSGNVTVTNHATGTTIWAGDDVSLGGSASTDANGVSSDKNQINSDVHQNDGRISSLSGDEYFYNFFKMDKATAKVNANIIYTGSTNTNYSSLLNGLTGKIIWIDHTAGGQAQLSGNSTIGIATSPVILIIDGDFKANGNTTIYGSVYVAQDWNNSGGGTLTIHGSALVEGTLSSTGTPDVTYDSDVINNTKNLAKFVKIPGSWRDF